ncbi:MAG: hypothetical protein FWC56_01825, partial [Phycisphaerae bacterium]|nr:hypothetical protein [Phycisphaerae bacterium]
GAGAVYMVLPSEADRLRQENEKIQREKEELKLAIQRLCGEDRVAEVRVTDQIRMGDIINGRPATEDSTTIEFVEIDREGHPLPSQRFVIKDQVVHFDALVLKFQHEDVAKGDPQKGKSLALFRRIYGDSQQPAQGYPIDPDGGVPNIFRVQPNPSEFEKKLWVQFWEYARDPELAARDGIRVAQGEAVYQPMVKGDLWTLSLQSNGGLNIKLRRNDLQKPASSNPSSSQATMSQERSNLSKSIAD